MDQINRYYYSLKQKILEKKYSKQKSTGTILMFHEVYRDGEIPRKPHTATSYSNFVRLINNYGAERFHKQVKSYDDILSMCEDDYIVTFDDVHRNAVVNAIPYLRQYSIPYILFVSLEFIDREFYITTKDLKELAMDPLCTIGSHAVHHRKFSNYPDGFIEELKTSANELHASLFAYPYGSLYAVSKSNIEDVKNCGCYSCAFSTISAHLTKENLKHRWMIPRINVNDQYVKMLYR